ERDKRTFGSSVRSVDDLFKVMTDDIRNRLKIDSADVGLGLGMLDDMEKGVIEMVGSLLLARVTSTPYMVMPLMDIGLVDVVLVILLWDSYNLQCSGRIVVDMGVFCEE
ncbi:hypothetical protein Tco_1010919, partial [Tanacetum coccineum]